VIIQSELVGTIILQQQGAGGATVTMCRRNPQQQEMHVGSVAAGPQQAGLPPARVETTDDEARVTTVPTHRSEPSTAPGHPGGPPDVTGSPRASPRSCLDTATSPASASSLRSPLERIEQLLELLINKACCDFAVGEPGLTVLKHLYEVPIHSSPASTSTRTSRGSSDALLVVKS
jgi:hypothetical protein